MKTLQFKSGLAIFITTMFLFSISACAQFSGIKGNGKVIKEDRKVSEFSGVRISNGIHAYIVQSDTTQVTVETDENVAKYLITEVKNGVLNVYLDESIHHVKTLKVYISSPKYESMRASSGATVFSKGTIKSGEMFIDISSGAEVKMNIEVNKLTCESSSGSDLTLNGKATVMNASSSSGSEIDAENLESEKCTVSTSSGANAHVFVTRELDAKASSGSQIHYNGNPSIVSKDRSSGGGISQK